MALGERKCFMQLVDQEHGTIIKDGALASSAQFDITDLLNLES